MSDEEFTGYAQEFAGTVYRVAFHTCKNAADSEDVLHSTSPARYYGLPCPAVRGPWRTAPPCWKRPLPRRAACSRR